MRLQFKHQKFQQDATNAVCDIFAGQPYSSINYRLDSGDNIVLHDNAWANAKVQIDDNTILERINKIQRENQIAVSKKLEGKYNLTIEMETGVGKTYTYIKTIFELNKRYGWSKFIIVVPSVAIREGVYKSLQITQEHFAQEYIDFIKEKDIDDFDFEYVNALGYKKDFVHQEKILLEYLEKYKSQKLNNPELLFKIFFQLFVNKEEQKNRDYLSGLYWAAQAKLNLLVNLAKNISL